MKLDILKPGEIKLAGIDVECDTEGGTLRRIHLRDAAGGYVLIEYADYSMRACGPAKPKMVKRWQVAGKISGLAVVPQVFEHEYEAKACAGADEALEISEIEIEDPNG